MAHCPLVAILRGVRPDEVVAIADVLVEAGFAMIEVPLNSPDPPASIAKIAGRYGGHVLIGAGTVLSLDDVAAVKAAGGRRRGGRHRPPRFTSLGSLLPKWLSVRTPLSARRELVWDTTDC